MDDVEERTLSGLTIRIERGLCIATQNCIRVAPEVFELGSDQIVTFREDAEAIAPDRLVEACAVCPTGTLLAFDGDGRRLAPR